MGQLFLMKNAFMKFQNPNLSFFLKGCTDARTKPKKYAPSILSKLGGIKMDPSETEKTYNTRKQQTRFYRVCSCELMDCATIFTPPGTGLSGILKSIFPKDQNMKKI